MRKIGVDVSRYNGRPNWATAKANGVQFAILRAVSGANGVYVDPTFEYNYAECKKAGVPVGLYVASYLNVEKEIAATEKLLKGKEFEYPIYYDIEDFSFTGRSKNRQSATNAVVRFCKHFERLGYYVGIYSNKYFIDQWLDKSQIKDFDIWIADWRKGVDYSKSFGMHQFTNRGRFTGIPSTGEGGVDTNYSYIDYPEIMKNYGLNGYAKPQPKSGGDNIKKKNIVIAYWNDGDLANAQALLNSLPGAALVRTKDASIYKEDYVIQVGGFDIKGSDRKVFGRNRVATLEEVTKVAKELNK